MQGIYAAGGPLIVYYAHRVLTHKSVFRATLSTVWLILNASVFASHLLAGRHTPRSLLTVLGLLPVLAVGIVIGEKLHGRIPERAFRLLVYSVLLLSGTSLVYALPVRVAHDLDCSRWGGPRDRRRSRLRPRAAGRTWRAGFSLLQSSHFYTTVSPYGPFGDVSGMRPWRTCPRRHSARGYTCASEGGFDPSCHSL